MTKEKTKYSITKIFLEYMCEKNTDKTRNLILHGHNLYNSIGRRIEDSDISMISEFLSSNADVVNVQLCYNNITDVGLSELSEFLKTDNNVKCLDLMKNNIGPEGIKSLLQVGKDLKLISLRLNGNKIEKMGGMYISDLLNVNEHLKHLDIGETHQTISSMTHLMVALQNNNTVTNLDVSRIIGPLLYFVDIPHFTDVFTRMIKVNSSIRELHLEKMFLTDFEIELLTWGLVHNSTMLMLDLSSNCIGDSGANYIAEFLRMKPPLEALMLNHNNIGNDGITYLAKDLPFSNVKYLDIAFNHISDRGLIQLTYFLRASKLLVLFIWGNVIKKVKTLQVLHKLLEDGHLKEETFDVKIYKDEYSDKLNCAYNTDVDKYKSKYYVVSPKSKIKKTTKLPFHKCVQSWPLPPSVIEQFGTPFIFEEKKMAQDLNK